MVVTSGWYWTTLCHKQKCHNLTMDFFSCFQEYFIVINENDDLLIVMRNALLFRVCSFLSVKIMLLMICLFFVLVVMSLY